jgi:REP element-mobilizing transposase RayT
MTYDPDIHHRRSIRLRGYDYSQVGMYFVTICTKGRLCLFGDVVDGAMNLNCAGKMVRTIWDEIPSYYAGVEIDRFVTMPNHIHGIITLVGAAPCGCPDSHTCPDGVGQPKSGQPQGVAPTGYSLSDVVHRFKTMTTKKYTDGVKHNGWQPFDGKLWQRNYYEHIIRDEEAYLKIAEYIQTNPQRWEEDTYHVQVY